MGGKTMKARVAILTLGVLLASCGGKGEAPTGQVVATVDGQEITAAELKLELDGAPTEGPAAAAAQQAALQNLVARKLLVAEAKRRDLDNTPVAAMLKKRAEDAAVVQLLQRSVADGVPKVSDDEVSEYIRSHPTTFAQRRLITVNQLLVPAVDRNLIKQMEPLKTLGEVEELLNRNNIKFIRSANVMDSVRLSPDAAAKIASLPNGEVIIMPSGSGAQVSQIVSSRTEPLTGTEAEQFARMLLTRQRTMSQVQEAMGQIVKSGQSKVKINPDYAPKAPAKDQAPPTK
jgi:EpsD family peptidyl-prolyl cis-trans isomerase